MALRNLVVISFALTIGSLSLAGCETFDVTVCRQPNKDCGGTALAGVPFNSRVPERAHYTKWLVPFDTITVTAKLIDDKGKDVASFQPPLPRPAYVYPHQGNADADLSAVVAIAQANQAQIPVADANAAAEVVREVSGQLMAFLQRLNDEAAGIPGSGQLAGNDIETQTMIDDAVYYLNYKRPLVGSVDGKVTLGADGTLSTAEGNVTDSTISSVLTTLATVATAGAAAAPAAAAAVPTATAARTFQAQVRLRCIPGLTARTCPPPHAPNKPVKPSYKLAISITITTSLQMIALKEPCAEATCDSAVMTLISLCDARHDKLPTEFCPGGDTKKPVQIASITPYPPPVAADSSEKKKPAKKATKGGDK